MKKIISLLAVLVSFLSVTGQNCPSISVSAPSSNVKEGTAATFSVNVSGGRADLSVTYNWSISAGTIESGQGTSVINVNTSGVGGQNITATVELGGLPAECVRTSSATAGVDGPPAAEQYNQGNYTTLKAFKEEADRFAGDITSGNYITQSPRAVIFLYPGKTAVSAAAIRDMTTAMKAALTKYGMKSTMYKIKTGAKKEQTSYELWIVPEGAAEPAN